MNNQKNRIDFANRRQLQIKILFLIFLSISFLTINTAYGQDAETAVTNFIDGFELTFDTPENYLAEISQNLAAGSTIFDLAIYISGMAVYAVFVWHFYRFIARREIIPIDYDKYDTQARISPFRVAAYIVAHIFLFPLIIFVWFFVYAMFMFVLAKDMPIGVVLLIAISVIGAIRLTSYYKEDLAKDLGKLLPLALLGVFLTSSAFYTDTANFFSLEELEEKFEEFPKFISRIVEFVILIVIIESILRVLFIIKRKILPAAEEKLEEQIEEQIDEKIKVHVEKIEKKQNQLENKVEKETDELEKKIEKETDDLEKKVENEKLESKKDKE